MLSQPSLSPRTQPPSPDLIVASEPADPFSEPNTLSLDDTYQLLKEPQVIIPVPFGIFTRSQVLGILDEAVKMVLEAKATQLSRKEEDLIGEGFDKGVASAAMICNLPLQEVVTDFISVKSHGVPQFVIDTLTWASRSKDRPDPSEFELWPIPPFSEIDRYLVKMKGSLKKLLGTYQDEDLHVYANGQVEMNISDEGGFFGQCEIRLDDTTLAGYVLGHIFLKGTAVVLSEVNRLFLYTPDASLDPEWSQMDGSMGAALERDSDGNLVLFRMPELEVVSLSDW